MRLGDALICAWRMDGGGGAIPLDLDDDPARPPAFDWLHLDAQDLRARQWLETRSGLPDFVVEALTAPETRPRFEPEDGGALINLRGINHNPGSEPEDMVSARVWVTGSRVVSTQRFPLRALDDLRAEVQRGAAPDSPGGLVARLALYLSQRIDPLIAEMVDLLDDLEDQVFDEGIAVERVTVAQARSEAAQIRRFLTPQAIALRALARADAAWVDEDDRRIFHEASEATARLIEDLDALRERAMTLHDLLTSQQADRMNRHTMALSIIAGIFLPLSLVAGMLGMNVDGIPLAGHPQSFWIIAAVLALIGLGELALFRLARWI